jgi:hypothetical protein
VKPDEFSRRKLATKPPFSQIQRDIYIYIYREREMQRDIEKESNEYSRMHLVEESLLRSRHSVGSETEKDREW